MKKIVLLCTVFLFFLSLHAEEKNKAFEMNSRLNRGINIGNTFEAPSEYAWGNPWDPSYMQMIADLGFSHIRLPIRWEPADRTMTDYPYTVSPDFLTRIKGVIDDALAHNLHIIINMHHHDELLADPAGQKARFLSQWQQIADYFKDYPDSLLFEILNEPHDQLTSTLWNQYLKEALAEIRKTNPERIVLIGTADWGSVNGLAQLEWPDDDYLILTVHYYNPFEFTHQGTDHVEATDVEWHDTDVERETVRQDFWRVRNFTDKHHVPVHVGEYGSYCAADIDSRARWTTYVTRFYEEQGYSWAYWEFNSYFGIYNPATGEYLQPLVDALLHNPLPEAVPTQAITIYESDFGKEQLDDWFFQITSDAQGYLSVVNNTLNLDLIAQGPETWHLQLLKFNVPLKKGEQYRLTFTASSTVEGVASSYVGRNDSPWDAYSQYYAYLLDSRKETYSYVFTMDAADDPLSRVVFDFGSMPTPATVTLYDVKLEKIQIDYTSNQPALSEVEQLVPVYFDSEQNLIINNIGSYQKVTVYSTAGHVVSVASVTQGINSLNATTWPSGIYLVLLEKDGVCSTRKILKKGYFR